MASKQYGYSKSLGEIREVEKHKRIVFTFRWADDTGFTSSVTTRPPGASARASQT